MATSLDRLLILECFVVLVPNGFVKITTLFHADICFGKI